MYDESIVISLTSLSCISLPNSVATSMLPEYGKSGPFIPRVSLHPCPSNFFPNTLAAMIGEIQHIPILTLFALASIKTLETSGMTDIFAPLTPKSLKFLAAPNPPGKKIAS